MPRYGYLPELDLLEPLCARALYLSYFRRRTQTQISADLGLAPPVVAHLIATGLHDLADLLVGPEATPAAARAITDGGGPGYSIEEWRS